MNLSATRNWAAALAALVALSGAAAAPVPSALSIQATVSLDTTNSLDPVGSATQSGTLRYLTGAGPASTASFSDTPASIAPSSALGGALTETFNGIGATLSMSGSVPTSGASTTDGLFADYVFMLSNSSLTETFTLTFVVQASNSVSAAGSDAFAYSKFVVLDSGNNELYANDQNIDTLNAGSNDDFVSASDSFVFILSPATNQASNGRYGFHGWISTISP